MLLNKINRKAEKALKALNLDLFKAENLSPPAPATIYNKIKLEAEKTTFTSLSIYRDNFDSLPEVEELYLMFDRFNWRYFSGKLSKVNIKYSRQMLAAGSYTPFNRTIKIGVKYHELFLDEIADTLKHEMIHIIHFHHDKKFKAEAIRIGASLKAKFHPSLKKPAKYLYHCKSCMMEYPRQKILRMASCGKCSPGGKFDWKFKLKLIKKK